MICIFYNCSFLLSLPDISKWNTNNVKNMNYLFYNCSSLSSLPNISKWNTSNAVYIIGIFYNCSSLSSLPNISKWKIIKSIHFGIFDLCFSLSLPYISKIKK